ncbi:MAG: CDP-archaeol synthase [Alphaproteobacteria bacterium]|nr:CDP-archaeol synthase [Alphaproteobacteria bacterium]
MSETMNRVLVAIGMLAVAWLALWLGRFGIAGVYWLCVIVVAGMFLEFFGCLWRAPRDVMFNAKNLVLFFAFLALLALDFVAITAIARRMMTVLMLLVVICSADIGAWFFGRSIGGDKMWEKISEHKTWAGQIFGIICGTAAAVLYGYAVVGAFVPQLVWIGISVALLSQYGDLTASFVKRKLGIKDFGHILGKHGGILDRFDGWIYVLPIMWMIMI